MSQYVGEIGRRIELEVKLIKENSFKSYFGFNEITTIYTMEDADGNVFVWKTSSYLKLDTENSRGDIVADLPRRGDRITLKATVKEHNEYKGTRQTVLIRVKVTAISHAKAELDAARASEQLASLKEGDVIWRMPYKRYKDHYSDCETIAGSYRDGRTHGGYASIEVIIRAGRLVPSGVRGKHYSGYIFEAENGMKAGYYAISEETARRRLLKDYPESQNWPCVKIYNYRHM